MSLLIPLDSFVYILLQSVDISKLKQLRRFSHLLLERMPMIYRMNGKRRKEQNWKNKRTKEKGRKVAFFTQLFLDTLVQGILLHSAYDWARYH